MDLIMIHPLRSLLATVATERGGINTTTTKTSNSPHQQ
jgi:hypothetical protein